MMEKQKQQEVDDQKLDSEVEQTPTKVGNSEDSERAT